MDPTPQIERKFQKELTAGTHALMLLAVLAQSPEPLYGYQIAKLLEAQAPSVKLGTLYPVLRSLESMELVEGRVEPSVTGPPRKYYALTSDGRTALDAWTRIWIATRDGLEAVLKGVPREF
jgi:PadR family transcriptional regulator PadR